MSSQPLFPSDIHLADMDLPPMQSVVSLGDKILENANALMADALKDTDRANLYMRMCNLLFMLHQEELGLEMQGKALNERRLFRLAGLPNPTIRLLVLMAPGGILANMPIEYLIEDSDIRLDMLYLLPGCELPEIIPDHDVMLVAMGEADANNKLLAEMEPMILNWPRPVLNPPKSIMHCARDETYRLLKDCPGLLLPSNARVRRENIPDERYPFIIRPVDAHRGEGLKKINSLVELENYLAEQSESEFYVADYIDYRSPDGLYRKSRIALIDYRPYICHFAISEDWVVHYYSAGMDVSSEKRAEEEAFMAGFDEDFVLRHQEALSTIAARLGLDYVVLDCGETMDGRLVLFEADNRALIHAKDAVDVFPYKQPVMKKAFDAFREMLKSRIQKS